MNDYQELQKLVRHMFNAGEITADYGTVGKNIAISEHTNYLIRWIEDKFEVTLTHGYFVDGDNSVNS